MNPRDRRLRLRKSTVRHLEPGNAAAVRGGTVQLETKKTSENMPCGTINGPGCVVTDQTDFTCPELWTCDTCYDTCHNNGTAYGASCEPTYCSCFNTDCC